MTNKGNTKHTTSIPPCGGLTPKEIIGLRLMNALHAGIPRGQKFGQGLAEILPSTFSALVGLIKDNVGDFKEVGFAGENDPAEAVLGCVVLWWKDWTHLDNLNAHPHCNCCIYPIFTKVFKFPTVEQSKGAAVKAAAKAGMGHDSKGEDSRSELFMDVFSELMTDCPKGLYFIDQAGSWKVDTIVLKDFLKKAERRRRLGPISPATEKRPGRTPDGGVDPEGVAKRVRVKATGLDAAHAAPAHPDEEDIRLLQDFLETIRSNGSDAERAASDALLGIPVAEAAKEYGTTPDKIRTAKDKLMEKLKRHLA